MKTMDLEFKGKKKMIDINIHQHIRKHHLLNPTNCFLENLKLTRLHELDIQDYMTTQMEYIKNEVT